MSSENSTSLVPAVRHGGCRWLIHGPTFEMVLAMDDDEELVYYPGVKVAPGTGRNYVGKRRRRDPPLEK